MPLADFQFSNNPSDFIFDENCKSDRYSKLMKAANEFKTVNRFRTNLEELHLCRGVDDFIGKPVALQFEELLKRFKEKYLTI